MSTVINPVRRRGLLAALKIPYTAFNSQFNLQSHVRPIHCTYAKAGTEEARRRNPFTVSRDVQLDQWEECRLSADTGEDSGWTLSVAGPGAISYPEAVAAELVGYYADRSARVAWVNVTSGLRGERALADYTRGGLPPDSLHALVVTGLRWDGDPARFDKAFDLLRETGPLTDRIIVGTGADPVAIARRLDLPIQRALNVVETKLVHM